MLYLSSLLGFRRENGTNKLTAPRPSLMCTKHQQFSFLLVTPELCLILIVHFCDPAAKTSLKFSEKKNPKLKRALMNLRLEKNAEVIMVIMDSEH